MEFSSDQKKISVPRMVLESPSAQQLFRSYDLVLGEAVRPRVQAAAQLASWPHLWLYLGPAMRLAVEICSSELPTVRTRVLRIKKVVNTKNYGQDSPFRGN